jgi:hypothetical protein
VVLEVCRRRVVDSCIAAADESLGALAADGWSAAVLGDQTIAALGALSALRATRDLAGGTDTVAACDALVAHLVRNVVPRAHLGLSFWQVRFATERPAMPGAAHVHLLDAGYRRFIGLDGVFAGAVARTRAAELVDGVSGVKAYNLYRIPPGAAGAKECLGTFLRDGDLSLVVFPAGALATTGTFEASALPEEIGPNPGPWAVGATIPVREPSAILTRATTVHVRPDMAFTGISGMDSLLHVGPVPLATQLLYPANIYDIGTVPADAVLCDAAATVGRAIDAYDAEFRVREYDIGGVARREARAGARRLSAEQWTVPRPGASFGERLYLQTGSEAQANEYQNERAQQAAVGRNKLLAMAGPGITEQTRSDVLKIELTDESPSWMDEAATEESAED